MREPGGWELSGPSSTTLDLSMGTRRNVNARLDHRLISLMHLRVGSIQYHVTLNSMMFENSNIYLCKFFAVKFSFRIPNDTTDSIYGSYSLIINLKIFIFQNYLASDIRLPNTDCANQSLIQKNFLIVETQNFSKKIIVNVYIMYDQNFTINLLTFHH